MTLRWRRLHACATPPSRQDACATLSPMKFLTALFALLFSSGYAAEVTTITPKAAAQLVADGKAVLVDVREPAE